MEGKIQAIKRGESFPQLGSLVLHATDAAKVVGLSASTLAKLRLNGNGPAYCKLGRRVVYRPGELDRWLQSRTTTDTTDANTRFLEALTAAHPRDGKAKNA